MQAPFVDLSVGAEIDVLPAHNGRRDVPGERHGEAEFLTSDFMRGHAGEVLVEWPDGQQDWVPIRRVPSACDRRIEPIVLHETGEAA